MKISVLIPAYNCAATIQATLESVLQQTAPPYEVLVMDDGSTDETAAVLERHSQHIKVLHQSNAGISAARNALIRKAKGDLIAFLDADDLWHPRYLEAQLSLIQRHPGASATFVEHLNFCGLGPYQWENKLSIPNGSDEICSELFEPLDFIRRLWTSPGPFVMSFCCVPKRILFEMGEPFRLREAEDVYFCNRLPFWGPVAFASAPPLAAYRIREGSLASNRLKCTEGEVKAFEMVQPQYESEANVDMQKAFHRAFASKRRALAKILLGLGRTGEARRQLRLSLVRSGSLASLFKSLGVVVASYIPKPLQPKWPSIERQWNPAKS